MREDKADVVAYLKRTLTHRTDQIAELQARLEGLQQVHKTDGENYEKRLSNLEQEFSRTKEELASENMVLTKKLDALEEFRIQREQLMAKYDEQEASKDAQKQEYEERIYELEKKHIIEEDRLKKEMMSKLEAVAAEFRKASHAQMSATTQRTIRENVNVTAQVMQLSEKAAELSYDNDNLQVRKFIAMVIYITNNRNRIYISKLSGLQTSKSVRDSEIVYAYDGFHIKSSTITCHKLDKGALRPPI